MVMAALDEQFANSSAETLSESEASFLGDFMQNFRIFFQLAEALGIVVVMTIGLVAANTAAMSIRERRSEIAVMRSIGFPSLNYPFHDPGRIADSRAYRRRARLHHRLCRLQALYR